MVIIYGLKYCNNSFKISLFTAISIFKISDFEEGYEAALDYYPMGDDLEELLIEPY